MQIEEGDQEEEDARERVCVSVRERKWVGQRGGMQPRWTDLVWLSEGILELAELGPISLHLLLEHLVCLHQGEVLESMRDKRDGEEWVDAGDR
jgi:hypothetical protein